MRKMRASEGVGNGGSLVSIYGRKEKGNPSENHIKTNHMWSISHLPLSLVSVEFLQHVKCFHMRDTHLFSQTHRGARSFHV